MKIQRFDSADWKIPEGVYAVHAFAFPEADGWSIIAERLPGLASQGDTMKEAIENFKEAAVGVLSSYLDADVAIPWQPQQDEKPKGAYHLTIYVREEK